MIQLSQLMHLQPIEKVIIQSIDVSLYQLAIEINGETFQVADNRNRPVRAFNIIELQKLVRPYHYQTMVLRHESAYDEMIGQPERPSNQLEVLLKDCC